MKHRKLAGHDLNASSQVLHLGASCIFGRNRRNRKNRPTGHAGFEVYHKPTCRNESIEYVGIAFFGNSSEVILCRRCKLELIPCLIDPLHTSA